MTRIAGASQYLSQSMLAQKTGSNFAADNVLTNMSSSLLDTGRRNAVPGIGLSARARAMTNAMLENSASTANQMFSMTAGASTSVEAAQTQIAALRSSVPLSREVFIQDDGTVSSSRVGATVNEEA